MGLTVGNIPQHDGILDICVYQNMGNYMSVESGIYRAVYQPCTHGKVYTICGNIEMLYYCQILIKANLDIGSMIGNIMLELSQTQGMRSVQVEKEDLFPSVSDVAFMSSRPACRVIPLSMPVMVCLYTLTNCRSHFDIIICSRLLICDKLLL